EVLNKLYNSNLGNESWLRQREHVLIGCYKEHSTCGNSSVSMGAATSYFRKSRDADAVGLLNCGTGPFKTQSYGKRRRDGRIFVSCDQQQPNKRYSVNNVALGKYKPKEEIKSAELRNV